MQQIKSWKVDSIRKTQSIAKELSTLFKMGDIILMQGTLGTGKTFLVQEICKQWAVKEDVTSPTFTLIQHYKGIYQINHLDLYRIENMDELDQLGWDEMIYSDAVTFIEWPELLEKYIDFYYKISIDMDNDKRVFELWKCA